jgi:probable HAF family extracellular repeat protein
MYEQQKTPQSRTAKLKTLALAFLLGPVASISALADYQLFDLGIDVSPTDINNAGTIVGSRKTNTGTVAFRRPYGGPLEDINGATVANAVNEYDQITGNTPKGAFLLDGNLSEWAGYGGYGINEAGQISGNQQLKNPYRSTPLPLDPAIYTPNKWDNLGIATVYSRGTRQGVYADLYVLNDINDTGFAVGSRSRYGLAGSSSILTTPAFNAVTYLSTPNGGSAKAINNQNMIVGTTGSNSSAGQYAHAYLYDYSADSLLDLGTLNGGLTSSAADINESSQVVGTSWLVTQLTSLYDPTLYHAFLWENGQMTDLNDATIEGNSGWILTAATAINDSGDIVGSGLLDGQVHGFLLATGQALPPPVGELPVAMASANRTAGRVPLTVNFSSAGSHDPDGTLVGYTWSFGDGTADTNEANPSHDYTVPGTYTAVLTVTDAQGLTATAQVTITARKSKGRK